MIPNFFKTAWRNLLKGKLQSVINITGLSIGMAVAVVIGLWIYGEVSFDKSFKNYDRIGQMLQNIYHQWRNIYLVECSLSACTGDTRTLWQRF